MTPACDMNKVSIISELLYRCSCGVK